MSEITVTTKRWPIVDIHFPPKWSAEEWATHVAKVAELIKRDRPFVIINDARGAPVPSAKERAAMAKVILDARFRVNVRAVGIVVSSPMLRAVATALHWIAPTPVPMDHFATKIDAERWCRERLEERRAA